ncbi:MAG: transporter substrate-binding domain-containing protein [Nocardioides sp.]|uniref:transporter substrate-binding domain-containing protein n=1 Tax=Nocardioides sp. TaxID=35761 RepID=UPI0039E34ED2
MPFVLAVAGCAGDGDSTATVTVTAGASTSATATTLATIDPTAERGKVEAIDGLSGYAQQLAQQGTIRIGVKYDAPGLGYLSNGASAPSGFEIEVAKILAGGLGISPDKIQWVQTVTSTREQALTSNTADLVIATYSMTREREQQVGMAGPYYITGAQLLVRAADQAMLASVTPGPNGNPRLRSLPASLDGRICTTTTSTTANVIVHEFKLTPVLKESFAECVSALQQGTVDALATDGVIELGYAAASGGSLKVIGDPWTEEKYGVGYAKGLAGMCDYIQKTLLRAYKDGSWLAAFEDTLGQSGADSPEPPAFEPC